MNQEATVGLVNCKGHHKDKCDRGGARRLLMCKTHQCSVIKYNIPIACFLSNFLDFITPVSDHLSLMEQKQRGSAHPSREEKMTAKHHRGGYFSTAQGKKKKKTDAIRKLQMGNQALQNYTRADF